MKIAITGASGKTGYRIAEEAIKKGHEPILIVRKNSLIPNTLDKCKVIRINIQNPDELKEALKESKALIIATGARPSIDLTGPLKVDAIGVNKQIECCKKLGIKRVILVSSLCAGRFWHPLNLFGLILIWKRIGEKSLENSNLDWTIIRPGGLTEKEENLNSEGIFYTSSNLQEDSTIPRRLVAKCCLESLRTDSSIGKIIEVTSNTEQKKISMKDAIKAFN